MPDGSVQGQLADHQAAIQGFGRDLLGGYQDAQSDGQIVGGTFFAHRGRGQVDRDTFARVDQSGILDGRLHALTAFLNGGIGQTNDDDTRVNRDRCLLQLRR